MLQYFSHHHHIKTVVSKREHFTIPIIVRFDLLCIFKCSIKINSMVFTHLTMLKYVFFIGHCSTTHIQQHPVK